MRLLSIFLLSLCLSSPLFAADISVADAAPVNINTADAETLVQALKGVGQSKAKAIIEYRETYGQFETLEELESVKGIGPAIVEKNREHIVLK